MPSYEISLCRYGEILKWAEGGICNTQSVDIMVINGKSIPDTTKVGLYFWHQSIP